MLNAEYLHGYTLECAKSAVCCPAVPKAAAHPEATNGEVGNGTVPQADDSEKKVREMEKVMEGML